MFPIKEYLENTVDDLEIQYEDAIRQMDKMADELMFQFGGFNQRLEDEIEEQEEVISMLSDQLDRAYEDLVAYIGEPDGEFYETRAMSGVRIEGQPR